MTTNNNLIEELNALKLSLKFYLSGNIGIECLDKAANAINESPFYSKFYKEDSVGKIVTSYKEKVAYLKKQLEDSDQDECIANILEYIRYTIMDNDFLGIPNVIFFENLCNTPLTSALIGKGTSYSKCHFLKSLLPDNIESEVDTTLFFEYPKYYETAKKDYTVTIKLSGRRYYLDPDKYTGYKSSKRGLHAMTEGTSIEEYPLSPKIISTSRQKVSSLLIEEYKISEFLSTITNPNMDQEQVLNKLIEYIVNNIISYDFAVKHYSIIINGNLLEATKLLELLLIAASIPFKIVENGQRENCLFEIEIDGIKRTVDLKSEIEHKKEEIKLLKKN